MGAESPLKLKYGVCPVCLRKISLATFSGSLVRCECGVSIFLAKNGRLVASLEGQNPELEVQVSPPVNPLEISIDAGPREPQAIPKGKDTPKAKGKSETKDNEQSENSKPYQRRNRNRTPLVWTSGAMIALFFAALVFVVTRTPPSEVEANKSKNTPAPVVSKPPAKLQRGTFERLIAEAPAPTSANKVALKSEAKPQADGGPKENSTTKPNVPGFRKIPPPSPASLPEPNPIRRRLKIPEMAFRGSIFMDMFDQAYEQYEMLGGVTENDESYPEELARTLAMTHQALLAELRDPESERQNELRYLMTYLSFKAGHLGETMVYGQLTAKLGDAGESSTRDAAMLALAAAQEASETQWGDPKILGELRHMRQTIELMQTKWPSDSQLNDLWMNLARRYQAFGDGASAIQAYRQVSQDAKAHPDALIAIGMIQWQQFRLAAAQQPPKGLRTSPTLNQAIKHLREGIKILESKAKKPTSELMFAKYNLAKIEALREPEEAMLKRLTTGKFPLTKSITSRKRHPANQVVVPANLLKAVYQLQHDVLLASGDRSRANDAIEEISKRTEEADRPNNQAQYLPTMAQEIKNLGNKKQITQEDLSQLEQQIKRVREAKVEISANDQVWFADSVAKLANRCVNPQLSARCYKQALRFAADAQQASDVSPALLRAVKMKEIDWLLGTRETTQAFDRLMDLLRESPNVIALQLKANRILEQDAIDSDSVKKLQAVMNGDSTNELPLWGWAKLAASLQQQRYSGSAGQQDSNVLLEAHFRLARCRWMLASVSRPTPANSVWAKQLRKQKNSFGLLIQPNNPDEVRWQAAMNNLTLE